MHSFWLEVMLIKFLFLQKLLVSLSSLPFTFYILVAVTLCNN
jgi:hypothetical protein